MILENSHFTSPQDRISGSLNARTRILMVDDQATNLIALEASLQGVADELVSLGSGAEAIAYLKEQEVSLILLDVQMPGLNGFDAAKQIRAIEKAKHTPIIFLTAVHMSEDFALKGYEAGGVDYLFKPLNADVLRAKVSVFIDLFRKNEEIKRQKKLLSQMEAEAREREILRVKTLVEKRYRNLVEGIREGIVWAADPFTLDFSFVSPHAERISGCSVEAWMETPTFLEKHLHPDDRDAFLFAVNKAAKSEARGGIEHRFVKPDGEVIWLYTDLHLEPNERGDAMELRGLSVDITHLKETEHALRQAVKIRDDFLSIASHELRTPITPLQLQMQGFIHLLETGKMTEVPVAELKEMLEISDSQITRLARLVGQLLDVSRLSAGRLKLVREDVDLSELLQNIRLQCRYEIQISDCIVSLELEPGVKGNWDRARLEQAIVNLLTNSLKYGAGWPIHIKLRSEGVFAVLEVSDLGIGIPKEDQERVFEQFERAVSPKHFGGLGLGLYITKQIVELHRGQIIVDSEPGKGATFKVRIPKC